MSDPYASPYSDEIVHDEVTADSGRSKADTILLPRAFSASAPDARLRLRIEKQVSGACGKLASSTARASQAVEDMVEDHPWKSLAVIFSLGCMLTLSLARLRQRP